MLKGQLTEIWHNILSRLEQELTKPSFDTWLKSTGLHSFDGYYLTIVVPNEFAKDWLETRYFDIIKKHSSEILNKDISLKFVIAGQEDMPGKSKNDKKAIFANNEYGSSTLNPKYIFETFVVGNSNRFAHAASLAVAEAIAKAYNPLFIYGGVGLGKTHLMHAIGHYAISNHTNLRVMYVSSEKFTNELINAIKDDKTAEFRNKYRNIDILLIDDIQFLAGKERTQEEFFHTFNALHDSNKQIIISSDRPPKDIPTLEDRLRSRFEWGLITDIQAPDLETRIAILRKKSELENFSIPNEVMVYIANKIHSNIRELEGALIRVIAYSSLSNKEISMDLCMEALRDILPNSKSKPITLPLIQTKVADHFGLRLDEFKSKRKTRNVAFPRQVAMYLCRELTDLSLPQIGEDFGGRDHTTVMHAHEKISNGIKKDPQFDSTIQLLIEKIKNE